MRAALDTFTWEADRPLALQCEGCIESSLILPVLTKCHVGKEGTGTVLPRKGHGGRALRRLNSHYNVADGRIKRCLSVNPKLLRSRNPTLQESTIAALFRTVCLRLRAHSTSIDAELAESWDHGVSWSADLMA